MTTATALDARVSPASLHTAHHQQSVLWTRHWTDSLFSFAIERPTSFRFRSGEFVMIGLPGEGRPILRAYSIASSAWAEELEFFSIKVPDGPLTSRLQKITAGDVVLLGRKPTGTLVLDALKPGRRLFLLGTGTGLAPFLSLVRDPDIYERFDQVVVVHTVREVRDLAYGALLESGLSDDPLVGDEAPRKLLYYPTVTREAFVRCGRITERVNSGAFFDDIGIAARRFDPETDRVMLCGGAAFLKECAGLLHAYGLSEGSNAAPREFVVERAFVG